MSPASRLPLRPDGLPVALLIAVVAVASAVVFDLPWLATTVGPALWIAFQGSRRRCRPAPAV